MTLLHDSAGAEALGPFGGDALPDGFNLEGLPADIVTETTNIQPMPLPPELATGPITYNDIVAVVDGITDNRREQPFCVAGHPGEAEPVTSLEELGPMPPLSSDELAAASRHSRVGRVVAKIREFGFRGAFREAVHDAKTVDMTRRQFLRDSAGAVAFTALAANAGAARYMLAQTNNAMAEHWPKDAPSLNFIGEMPKNPKELAIFFPGFGDIAGASEAETLKAQGHIDPEIPIAYMDYSSRGPESVAQLAQVIRETVPDIDKLDSITIVGRSLGGPIGLGVAALLGKPVKVFMSLSSPYDPGDADKATIGTTLARLPDDRIADAGIKYGISLWDDINGEQPTTAFDDFKDAALKLFTAAGGHGNFHQAIHETVQGLSKLSKNGIQAGKNVWYGADPLAQQHELRTWWNEQLSTDPRSLNPTFMRGIRRAFIPGFTKFYYTCTDHPSTDKTVNVIAGAYHWRDFALNVAQLPEKDVEILGLPYDGHADMGVTVHRMAPILRKDTEKSNNLADSLPINSKP